MCPRHVKCFVPLCGNSTQNVEAGMSWHRLPKDLALRKKWFVQMRYERKTGTKASINGRVCSAHFVPSDFRQGFNLKKRLLTKEAVPSLFQWTTKGEVRAAQEKRPKSVPQERDRMLDEKGRENVAAEGEQSSTSGVIKCERYPTRLAVMLKNEPGSEDKVASRCPHCSGQASEHQETVTTLKTQLEHLKRENQRLREMYEINQADHEKERAELKRKVLVYGNIRHDAELVEYYTGFPNAETYDSFLAYLKPLMEKLDSEEERQMDCGNDGQPFPPIDAETAIETEFFIVMLKIRFAPSDAELERMFSIDRIRISAIFDVWIALLYRELRVIYAMPDVGPMPGRFVIECAEVGERKDKRKLLVAATLDGIFCFVSRPYSRWMLEQFIADDCGILNNLRKGCAVVAEEERFLIADLLPDGVLLNSGNLSVKDLVNDMKSALRRLVTTYDILGRGFDRTRLDNIGEIFAVCTFLTNFKRTPAANA